MTFYQFVQAVDVDGAGVDELKEVLDGGQAVVRHDDGQHWVELKRLYHSHFLRVHKISPTRILVRQPIRNLSIEANVTSSIFQHGTTFIHFRLPSELQRQSCS